jgi:hypothetical protein
MAVNQVDQGIQEPQHFGLLDRAFDVTACEDRSEVKECAPHGCHGDAAKRRQFVMGDLRFMESNARPRAAPAGHGHVDPGAGRRPNPPQRACRPVAQRRTPASGEHRGGPAAFGR